jgi:hypothetical protein
MISQKDIEKALDFLRDSGLEAARAISEYEYVESYLSVIKAELMSEHPDLAVNAQEREAKRHQRYKDHLDIIRTARHESEKYKFLIDAAKAKISAWQTMEKANANV